jgi:hypothetical protein
MRYGGAGSRGLAIAVLRFLGHLTVCSRFCYASQLGRLILGPAPCLCPSNGFGQFCRGGQDSGHGMSMLATLSQID